MQPVANRRRLVRRSRLAGPLTGERCADSILVAFPCVHRVRVEARRMVLPAGGLCRPDAGGVVGAGLVFGPEDVPTVNSGTITAPGTSGYPYATVSYLNANGKEVNTATPGGHIDTVEYDKFGNTIRTLQATDREIALGTHPTSSTYLADLGLSGLSTSARADALSTVHHFARTRLLGAMFGIGFALGALRNQSCL
jgi:hypothetical protein